MKLAAPCSVALLLLLAAGTLRAEDPPAAPREPVAGTEDPVAALAARIFAARTPEERSAACAAAATLGTAETDALAAKLEAGRAYAADAPKGWLRKTVVAPDGKERPYLLHVPADYDPAKPRRMVIDMHGGVSRPAALTHDDLEQMKFAWGEQAEKDGWIIAYPSGQTGCVWWDSVGSGMVLGILRETKRTYRVDEDAVFATGFSDGGSGSWFLAAAHPTPFAGFIPLNGHPGVAQMGGTPIFARNWMNRRVYAVNTDRDGLYPSAGVKPLFDAVLALGAPLVWRDITGFGHDPSYLATERPAIVKWMDAVRRDPAPKVVWWEGADGAPSRADWLRVTKVTGGSGEEPFPDVNPMLTETRVRIGVVVDQAFGGPGVRVQSVQDGSPAQAAGVLAGDVVVAIDAEDVRDFAGLRKALGSKKFGDDLTLRWMRGTTTMWKKTAIPAARSEPTFDRKAPWGTIRAEAKGNRIEVACRGVGSFEVLLSPRLADLAKPVEIVVNGEPAFAGTVAADPGFMVRQWFEDEDRSLVCRAKVAVTVPAAAK